MNCGSSIHALGKVHNELESWLCNLCPAWHLGTSGDPAGRWHQMGVQVLLCCSIFRALVHISVKPRLKSPIQKHRCCGGEARIPAGGNGRRPTSWLELRACDTFSWRWAKHTLASVAPWVEHCGPPNLVCHLWSQASLPCRCLNVTPASPLRSKTWPGSVA